jgi:hypothetical protein
MKSLIRIASLTLLMIPAMLTAQEPTNPLAGYWEGTFQGSNGAERVLVELRVQGDAVTGPIFLHGDEQYIRNGTVTGNTIAFTSPRLDAADRDVPLTWTGQLAGNELAFSVVAEDRGGPVREFVLTRQVR